MGRIFDILFDFRYFFRHLFQLISNLGSQGNGVPQCPRIALGFFSKFLNLFSGGSKAMGWDDFSIFYLIFELSRQWGGMIFRYFL